MRLRAHAKINLDLRVGARHPDGYHDISTVFQALALHDVVQLDRRDGPLVVTSDDPKVPGGQANLCAKAVEALWRALDRPGVPGGYAIALEKRIPSAAGLGGGSSDAAAVIVALAGEWGVPVQDPRVRAAAARVGADVPYFLIGGTALGVGRGDVLTPLDDGPAAEVVLVQPAFGLSTAEVYGLHDAATGAAHARGAGGLAEPVCGCRNDLERAVVARRPEIREIGARLRRLGARFAAMTGSGSVVFGLFDAAASADRAAVALQAPGHRVLRTATLDRQAYLRSQASRGAP